MNEQMDKLMNRRMTDWTKNVQMETGGTYVSNGNRRDICIKWKQEGQMYVTKMNSEAMTDQQIKKGWKWFRMVQSKGHTMIKKTVQLKLQGK